MRVMPKIFVSLATALAVLTAGCASMQDVNCRTGERRMTSELLYFGTVKPGGKVEATDWESFLNEVVTPRFPLGLSVWPASGQWRAKSGQIVQESSYVLNIVHSGGTAEMSAIEEVAAAY